MPAPLPPDLPDSLPVPDFAQSAHAALAALSGRKIAVAGDVMLDRYVFGAAGRLSPEAPVPVLNAQTTECRLGGAGNVLANLAGLGVDAQMFAVTGRDAERKEIVRLVSALGQSPAGLIADPARATGVKTRYLAGGQQLLRADFETAAPVSAETGAALVDGVRTALDAGAQALVLSDYGKGVLGRDVCAALIRQAQACGVPVFVDPKGRDYTPYAGADYITPNKKELSEATGGRPVETDADVVDAAQALLARTEIGTVVATRAEAGMTLVSAQGAPLHLRTAAQEVFDVSGAGDTVIAALAAFCGAGTDIATAARLANIAAGIVVGKIGTASVHVHEIRERIPKAPEREAAPEKRDAQAGTGSSESVISGHIAPDWAQAEAQAACWRAAQCRVGFTNGCFDILHAGHVRYLAEARAQCDRLVVALNCDASVRRLKGNSRPLNTQEDRAAVLAALAAVDLVVLFGADAQEKDTAENLIRRIRPDIYFKGGDYAADDILEAPAVRACGGVVKTLSILDGRSTTALLGKICENAD